MFLSAKLCRFKVEGLAGSGVQFDHHLHFQYGATQRAQYTLIKEYTLNYRGLNIMILRYIH